MRMTADNMGRIVKSAPASFVMPPHIKLLKEHLSLLKDSQQKMLLVVRVRVGFGGGLSVQT